MNIHQTKRMSVMAIDLARGEITAPTLSWENQQSGTLS